MGMSLDFTVLYIWLALAGAVLPTALYVACVVVGTRRGIERPYLVPTAILVAMTLPIVLGFTSSGFREHVLRHVVDDELIFSWNVELLASAGLVALILVRNARKHAIGTQFALTDLACCVGMMGALIGAEFGLPHDYWSPEPLGLLWAVLIPLVGLVGCSSKKTWAYPLICLGVIALRQLGPVTPIQSEALAIFLALQILFVLACGIWLPFVKNRPLADPAKAR